MVASLKPENHFRHDVFLDLVGSAENRQLAVVEVLGSQRRRVLVREEVAVVVHFQFLFHERNGIGANGPASQIT